MARYPYLLNRKGHYYFRIAVPLFHLNTLGRKEFIYSLKTKDLTQAQIRSAALFNVIQEVFQLASIQGPDAAYYHLEQSLKRLSFQKHKPDTYPDLLARLAIPEMIPDTHLPKGSEGKGEENNVGDHSLSNIIDTYIKEKIRLKTWSQRSIKSKKTDLSVLKEILGEDYNITSMSDKEARQIKSIILDMPVNRRKNIKTRYLSIHEAIKVERIDKISVKTAQLTIGSYYSFFEWAKDHKIIKANFFDGLTIETPKGSGIPKRSPFNDEGMREILNQLEVKKQARRIKDYQYWGTLLGAYTGARLNELAQMEVTDVCQSEGIWCLSLNDEGEGKHLKNTSSKRLVPIHQTLLDKGFLNYVENLKGKHGRVLHELTYDHNNGYGRNLGQWFNKSLLPELGLKTKLHVFHSLRHTVVTRLMRAGVEQPIVRAIIGHTQEGVLQNHYFLQGYSTHQLSMALTYLKY